jgi:plastocyanin
MRREFIILLALCSIFLAIGCAGTKQQPNETETPVEAVTPVQGVNVTSNESKVVDVSIVNYSFSPETVTISTGETVKWTNMESVNHTVTGASFESKTLAQGGSYEFLFTEPGTYEYHCSIHPSMKGIVIVENG